MKFLADQDVYASTTKFLRALGHDVILAAQLGLSQHGSITRSHLPHARRDFGGLVFVAGMGSGVIYLRMLPSTLAAVHAELERLLNLYTESELLGRDIPSSLNGQKLKVKT